MLLSKPPYMYNSNSLAHLLMELYMRISRENGERGNVIYHDTLSKVYVQGGTYHKSAANNRFAAWCFQQ